MNKSTPLLSSTAATAIASALALGSLSSSAHADSLLPGRSIVVHFADLDTNNTLGAGLLYNRIKLAAETVCSDLVPWRSLSISARYATCVRATLSDAIGKVDRPLLTDYALAHGVVPSGPPLKEKVARAQPH